MFALLMRLMGRQSSLLQRSSSRYLHILKMNSCRNYSHLLIIGLILSSIPASYSASIPSIAIASSSMTTTSPTSPTTANSPTLQTAATSTASASSPASTAATAAPPELVTSTIPPSKEEPTVSPTPESRQSRMQFANTPFIRLNRMNTGSRTNSRFLRTFPPLEYLQFARREGQISGHGSHLSQSNSYPSPSVLDAPNMGHGSSSGSSSSSSDEGDFNDQFNDPTYDNQLGNSPIFYIRLPPAPYVLVPGLGYISPHPYNNNAAVAAASSGFGAGPMMMSPLGPMDFPPEQNNLNNNVISLPLKFLSNARPATIVGAKPSKGTGIHGGKGKHTTLLSGGKYSFNGRPNGVFIVRSPAASRIVSSMSFV